MSNKSRFSEARRRLIATLALVPLAMGLLLGAPPALADPLDGPRERGVVGERVDGYAAIRDAEAADAGTRALVEEINAKRKAFYAKRASEEGVATEAIAKIYAKKIYEKAPAGWWFRTASGNWVRK